MIGAFYAQVFSIGLLWVFFHCGGMCGPIIAGITAGNTGTPKDSPFRHAAVRAQRVIAYQTGRALTYALLGAAAGLAGSAFETSLRGFSQSASLLLALILVGIGITRLPFITHALPEVVQRLSRQSGSLLGKILRIANRASPRTGLARFLFMGALLGLLPCMLMFWVLSIATSTASPVHGAGVMLLLVLMTTPTLLVAGCAAALPTRKFRSEHLVPVAMILSGTWLLLIAAAANSWIEHIHLQFELFSQRYVLMLW